MTTCELKALCAPRVKEATRASHEAAEAIMNPLIAAATTPDAYGVLLKKLYGFYRPMEQLLVPFASQLQLDYNLEKSHLILQDLQTLGVANDAAICTKLPEINNWLDALGALYVLEGASLGGRIIARMLTANGQLPPNAFSFFDGRGKETGPHWTRFTQLMNQQAVTEEEIEQVCAAATATFDLHAEWMKTL